MLSLKLRTLTLNVERVKLVIKKDSNINLAGKLLLGLSIILCIPGTASADAGVPMIFIIMPVLGLSIIPIIVIEAAYLCKKLELNASVAAKTACTSNLVSTVVGVPLTWLLLVLVEIVVGGGKAFGLSTTAGKILSFTLQAAWLIPYESDLHWIIPAASLVLLVPFFFVSWWTEYLVSKKMLKGYPAHKIKLEVRNANIITYSLLALWPLGFWVLNSPTVRSTIGK